MKKLLLFLLVLTTSSVIAQKVAVIGINHESNFTTGVTDGFSFVATENLTVGEVIYFAQNEYNNSTNKFNNLDWGVVKFTVTAAINKGNVIYVEETGVTTDTFTVTASSGAGTATKTSSSGNFSIAPASDLLYAYTDTDDDPTNGVTTIYAILYTGTSPGSGGTMPAIENPTPDFPNAIVVHNFPEANPATGPGRVEYKTSLTDRTNVSKTDLENQDNYLHGEAHQALSTTVFTNFNLSGGNPIIGVAKDATVAAQQVTFNYYIENLGNVNLSSLSLTDDLDAVFGAGNYTVTNQPTFIDNPGTINLNTGFNGSTNMQLIIGGSTLAVGDTAQIRLVINVTNVTDQGSGMGNYSSQSTISASDTTTTVNDLSDNGTDPDPDGDGVSNEAGENDPTPFTVVPPPCSAATRLYVNSNASGANNGTSWANAFTNLQDALNCIDDGEEIWVAKGTYTPGTLEADSFIIPESVTVLGGFNGTEANANERNWAQNPTILSGDLDGSETANAGDSHTIVSMLSNNAELNGFFIQWGYADDDTDISQPAIGRSGAGIYNNGDNRIYNCTIRSNVADANKDPKIGIGAGLVSFGGTLNIINCLFNSNRASANGGAISAEAGTINIMNCTIANNTANKGGGVHFFDGNVHATNTIFTNNSGTNGNINDDGAGMGTANYCLFYNTTTGNTDNTNNLPPNITGSNNIVNADPIYTNGYQIKYSSPARDAGDTNANNLSLDLNANNRISNTTIDIGAYEYQNGCSVLGAIAYVDQNATGNEDGSSWANAFTSLESALALQDCGFTGEIRVASGTYYPSAARGTTLTNPTEFYFWINKNIKLKGSYNPATNTQDFTNPSILSGNLGTTNTVHVLVTTNLGNTALIEGFTITGGAAVHSTGSLTIGGQVIQYNQGGGMYNANSKPSITNTQFVGNSATYGGGMYNQNASPSITNALFFGNSAGEHGAGMYNDNSSSSMTNVLFVGNSAKRGGGIYNANSSPSIANAHFVNNSKADYGGGIFNQRSSVALYNSVFYGNGRDIDNSSASSLSGVNNFSQTSYSLHSSLSQLPVDPFINRANPVGGDGVWGTQDDGLYPATGSVLIDAGANSQNSHPTDIAGNTRVFNGTIDVGAYEYAFVCPYPTATTLFVDASVSGVTNDGSSWANAYNNLQDAIWQAYICSNITEIWVAKGTYTPGSNQINSFVIPENLNVLGGFNGTEATASERNWAQNPTILSGDLNGSETADAGDSHTIIRMPYNNSTLDGFIIAYSYADGTENIPVALGRAGGGVYNNGNNNTIKHCIFKNNTAQGNGTNGIGGAIVSFSTDILTIYNSLFYTNKASANGGALSLEKGTTKLINCTVANNTATKGGGVHFYGGNLEATNTIFTNNSGTNGNINDDNPTGGGTGTASYCLFYNTTTGNTDNTNNLPPNITGSNNIVNADPIYTNGYQISYSSPARDAGDTNANNLSLDLNANNRISNTTIDIGAYEYQNGCSVLGASTIAYVDQNATGNEDGSSWANAFTSLESALALQDCGFTGEIRVASGTYYPSAARGTTLTNPTEFYFWINKNIKLKGSYNPATNTQDFTNPSILSGNLGTTNTVHVLVTTNLGSTALIEGFTITGGAAVHSTGSVTIGGQVIQYNRGGGMYNANSSPNIANTHFVDNSANYGGGMYNQNASPSITNAQFIGNSANPSGGGMYNQDSKPSMTNTNFVNNSANYGGGMYNLLSSSPRMTNTNFVNNSANYGGGMYNNGASVTLYNSVFYGNGGDIAGFGSGSISGANNFSETSYSLHSSLSQLSVDPFINRANPVGGDGVWGTQDDGLYPATGSVLVDAGANSHNSQTTDIAGNARVFNGTIDVGAYEVQTTLSTETSSNTAFVVYPNPVNNILNIKTINHKFDYSIYNIQGQIVLKASNITSKTINVTTLPTGVYILKLASGNKTENFKIIKQ